MSLLNEIQQKLKVPKSQFNAFGKYSYRNAEDILEAVKPLLGEGTLILDDEVQCVGGFNYVKATAKLYEKGELTAWATGWAREAKERKGMDDSQITGATSSYARKYALNGLFCIDDTKDADNHDNRETAPVASKKAATSDEKPTDKEMAAKDRIMAGLKQLKAVYGPRPDKAACVKAVKDLTGLNLEDGSLTNLEAIGEALWAKVEGREATK